MSESEQSHGVALVVGIGALLALAALWAQALPDLQAPGAPYSPRAVELPAQPPVALEVASPSAAPRAALTPSPAPPSLLGSTRGRAALELAGPGGPPVQAWIEGKVFDPEGRPLAGAEVRLESSSEDVVVRGQTQADGSFSLETSYDPDQIPRAVAHKLVARRAYEGGVAQAEQWVRVPGATRGLELKARLGFDLLLRFPFSIRSEVILGGGPGEVRKLTARAPAPTREVPGLSAGEVWVAVVGVDPSGGWWAGLTQGRVGGQAQLLWDVPLEPFASLEVSVTGPRGTPSPVKLVVVPLEGNRFRDSSLQRHGQGLDFEEADEEGPDLPEFGVPGKSGTSRLSLPPGPWRISAYGPPGTRPAHAEVTLGAGRAGDRELALQLGVGLACEFELPRGLNEGEVAVHGPAGAYLKDLGEGRWRVAGLAPEDRVEVYLLHSEAEQEGAGEDEAPLDEPAPTTCALLRLEPGGRGKLSLVRTATLRVLLPEEEGAEAWEVKVEDVATSSQTHSLFWDLDEDPLTPSGPGVTDDSPREQAWMADLEGALTFTTFERVVGRRVRSGEIEADVISLPDLFPGPIRVTATGPGGFSTTQTLELTLGETTTLDLR